MLTNVNSIIGGCKQHGKIHILHCSLLNGVYRYVNDDVHVQRQHNGVEPVYMQVSATERQVLLPAP